jgi:hypothetical protein
VKYIFKFGPFQAASKASRMHIPNRQEHIMAKKRSAWVAYLNRRKKHITDSSSRNKIKIGSKIENTRDKSYCRLSGTNLRGKQNNIHYQRPTKNPHTKLQKNNLLSTISSSITSLLRPDV